MNTDQKCFMWSVLADLYPVTKNPQKSHKICRSYGQVRLHWHSISSEGSRLSQIRKKEEYLHQCFRQREEWSLTSPSHLREGVKTCWSPCHSHYCCIKNFNRLKGDQDGGNNQYHYCHYCLHGFTKKHLLEKHIPYGEIHGAQKTEMPSDEEKWLKLSDISKQLRVPFVV